MAYFKPSQKPKIRVSADTVIINTPDFDVIADDFEWRLRKALPVIADEVKQYWKDEAFRVLNTTRELYSKSIVVQTVNTEHFIVSLGGTGGRATKQERWLAVALEIGHKPIPLKPGFLNGRDWRVIPLMTKDKGLIFRTVRKEAQATKWEHPGFEGIHLKERVVSHLTDTLMPTYVDAIIEDLQK